MTKYDQRHKNGESVRMRVPEERGMRGAFLRNIRMSLGSKVSVRDERRKLFVGDSNARNGKVSQPNDATEQCGETEKNRVRYIR